MRKKEEILLSMVKEMPYEISPKTKPYIMESMQIHADEQSIGFLEWLIYEGVVFVSKTAQNGCTYRHNDIVYTTSELLTIYKQENGII